MTQQLIMGQDAPAPPALGLRLDGSVALVNSRDVAVAFDKRHDHVLRDIDALLMNNGGPVGAAQDGSPDLESFTDQSLTWFICKPCHTELTIGRVPREQREAEFRAYQNKRRRLPGRQQTLFG